MPRLNRRRSIVTPARRDRLAPSKRPPTDDEGPTAYALQRQAEQIGHGTICVLASRRVEMTGGKDARGRAELAAASVQGRLYAKNLIGSDQYRAANEYARLHRLLWGRSTAKPSGLSRVLASGLVERIQTAKAAAQDQMDDDAYTDWMAEQRALYERAEYRLRHMSNASGTARRVIRMAMRQAVIDQVYPAAAAELVRVKRGLRELADVWGIE